MKPLYCGHFRTLEIVLSIEVSYDTGPLTRYRGVLNTEVG